ncbi:MAG: hypothetical protein ACTSP1_04115 [Candidatus Freyarchaeota archaeon]
MDDLRKDILKGIEELKALLDRIDEKKPAPEKEWRIAVVEWMFKCLWDIEMLRILLEVLKHKISRL